MDRLAGYTINPLTNISDSDFNDFLDFRLGSRDGLHSMLISFADESELSTESVPVIGVGGAIGSGMQWDRISRAWRKVLKTEPTVGIFHTQDFESPEGRERSVYHDWDRQRLNTFGGLLTQAICQNHVGLISAASVKVADWNDIAASRKMDRTVNAHFFCAVMLFEQQKDWALKFFPNEMITYYFESGGPHEKGLKKAYRVTIDKKGADEYFRFAKQPAFVPKDSYIELQIADKMIYESTKQASHYFVDNPDPKYAMPHPETKKPIWKTRYSPEQWVLSGLDIDTRWYSSELIVKKLDLWEW